MPVSLSLPALLKEFFLVKSDKTSNNQNEPSRIEVRYANVEDKLTRDELLKTVVWSESDNPHFRYTFDISVNQIWLKEVFLTLADCNICENDGEPLFRFADKRISMNEKEFQLAWGRLPSEYSQEIIEYVHQVNHFWADRTMED